jgi:uncharacterized surface protein with fasciclin (FAS1) repeats
MKTTILSSMLVVGLLAAMAPIGCAESEAVTDAVAACTRYEQGNILDVVAKSDSFSVLARAIEAADLADTLRGEGPFTVFAPTDEAFSKLPEGAIEQLLRPENKGQLRDLLLGHVAAGLMNTSAIRTMSAVATLGGEQLPIEAKPDGFMIAASEVTDPEIMASNGVIHVLDAVILPGEQATAPEETATPQQPSVAPPQGTIPMPQEPVIPQEPVTSQEPAIPQEPVTSQEPAIPQEPVTSQEPVMPQEPAMPQAPILSPEPMMPEEPGVAMPGMSAHCPTDP